MAITCKVCGNLIEDHEATRCPRCYTIIKKPSKCEECKGCSLKFKGCNK